MEILGLPLIYYGAMLLKVLVAFVFVLLTVAYATYAERKIIGHMQVRLGPMRTGWHGLLQPIADGDEVTVKAAAGELRLKAKVGLRLPQGVVFAPYHFGEQSLNSIVTGSAVTWVSISK